MFYAKAQLATAFQTEATDKYPSSNKVQLYGDVPLKDGGTKKELITLNVPIDVFNSLVGRIGDEVVVPISMFASGKNVQFFFPKGASLSSGSKKVEQVHSSG